MTSTILLDCCGCHGGTCTGRVLVVDDSGSMVMGECEKCGASFGVPVAQVNPAVKRDRLLELAKLPHRYAGKNFDDHPDIRRALAAVNSWLAAYGDDTALPAPALFGEQGRGKTHLLVRICERLINERRIGVAFYSTRRLLRELQNFEHDEDVQSTWRRAITVRVLALDDLGAQRQTEWRHDQLADLVDERYERNLPILLATNFAPSMWPHMLDKRTASRLQEMTFAVELGGVDQRSTQTSPVTHQSKEAIGHE